MGGGGVDKTEEKRFYVFREYEPSLTKWAWETGSNEEKKFKSAKCKSAGVLALEARRWG